MANTIKSSESSGVFKHIYRQVRRIPAGKVATYGDIALLCEEKISARVVGWAMNVAPDGVPWYRVISGTGWLSIGRRSTWQQEVQRDLLLSEGVEVSDEFIVPLDRYRWRPRQPRRKRKPARRDV